MKIEESTMHKIKKTKLQGIDKLYTYNKNGVTRIGSIQNLRIRIRRETVRIQNTQTIV